MWRCTPALPREGRIFLYLGYVILSVAVVNWALTAHNLGTLNVLTGQATLRGFEQFGKPLLYAIFVVSLTQAFRAGRSGSGTPVPSVVNVNVGR